MRQKVKAALKSWGDVDEVLRTIGAIDLLVQESEARMNAAIMKAKEQAKADTEFSLEQKKNLELAVKQYGEAHREDLGAKKSIALNFGTVSFRKSTRIVTIANLKRVLELLKARHLAGFIRVKESVDKEAMAELDDQTLKSVGCRRKTEDTFGYEIDFEKIRKGEAA